jgi:hypothetical protein
MKQKEAMMIRFILAAFLGLGMFLPMAQAEEEYEVTSCFAGTATVFNDSRDLTIVLSAQFDGILMSQSENKFLDNVTYHCEMVQRGFGENKRALGYCRNIDPDGDIVITELEAVGQEFVGKFVEGTGKYKGIKGSYKTERIAQGKPPMKGAFVGCSKETGTFELAK